MSNRSGGSPYLNVEAAAKYLGISPQTLNNLRSAGGGPRYRKHPNRVLYHVDELDDWSRRRRYDSTSDGPEGGE